MDEREVTLLRATAENRAVHDLQAGRKGGVLGWALVDTALGTGLRVSELAALTIGDYDPKRAALRVGRLKRKKPVVESLALGKELAGHLRDFIEWKATVGEPTGKADALFHGKRGPLSAQGLQQIWKAAIRRAGLPRELSIHRARHTLAVHLLRRTKNLRQVQKQLGHASPATTANMYADVTFEDMQAGLNGLYQATDPPQRP
jgi:integrase